MPIYEFKCDKCTKILEKRMKFSDPNPTTCPYCHEGQLNKIMSQTSFQLKGGGWFADSYSNAKPKSGEGADSADKGKSLASSSCAPVTS